MAVASASSCSSDSTPGLGTCICCRHSPKKKKDTTHILLFSPSPGHPVPQPELTHLLEHRQEPWAVTRGRSRRTCTGRSWWLLGRWVGAWQPSVHVGSSASSFCVEPFVGPAISLTSGYSVRQAPSEVRA